MLLSNLTASSLACSILLSLKVTVIPDARLSKGVYPTDSRSGSCASPVPYPQAKTQEVLALPLLIDAFVEGAQIVDDLSERTRKATLHFLASVFANLSMSPSGRDFFLTPQPVDILQPGNALEYPLGKLISFTEHSDLMRRSGVAYTIKNCAFHVAGHKAILSPESTTVLVPPSKKEAPGIDALSYLLLPLAGPEEFDLEDQEKLLESLQFLPSTKKREPDPVVRRTHIETLLLLCHTRWGRDYQRQHGVYEVVRVAHENETVDQISEHIERLVQLLQGDEPKITIADDEEFGSGKELDDLAAVSAVESDDEDNVIKEV